MEKVSAEEMKNIVIIRKGRETKLSAQLKQLQPGEGLKIFPKDIASKTSMYQVIRYVAKRRGWKVEAGILPDSSAYIVKRIS